MSEVTKQHTKLKNELRAIQRDFGNWLDKTANKTGPELKKQADFYQGQREKAAKKLDAFEKKNKLASYSSDKPKSLIKKGDRGRAAGSIRGGGRVAGVGSALGRTPKSLLKNKLMPKT
jgi:hypothetical protein